MPTTDTQLQQLVINVGTEEQITADIESGTITADQLSLTTNGPEYLTEDDVTSNYLATGTKPVNGQAVAEALTTKQNVLVSGGNIKTINGQSIVGSGNLIIEGGGGGIGDIDEITITVNDQAQMQAEGLIEQNKRDAKFDWVGTKAEYEALTEIHDDWIYYITDDYVSGSDIDDISIKRNDVNDLEATGVINQADKTRAVKMWTGTSEEFEALKNKNAWYGWKVNNTKYYTTSALPTAGDQVYDENLQPTNFVVESATTYQMKIIETEESGSEV